MTGQCVPPSEREKDFKGSQKIISLAERGDRLSCRPDSKDRTGKRTTHSRSLVRIVKSGAEPAGVALKEKTYA